MWSSAGPRHDHTLASNQLGHSVRVKRSANHIINNTKDKVVPLTVKILCDVKEGMSQRRIWCIRNRVDIWAYLGIGELYGIEREGEIWVHW